MSSAKGVEFPYANTHDNLFSSIMDNDRLVSKYRTAPPDLKAPIETSAQASSSSSATNGKAEGKNDELENQKYQNQKVGASKSMVNLPKYRICIDSVDKVAEASMLKSSFIVYRIRFSRVSDLQSHATWKRFKELNTWFLELQRQHAELAASAAVKFPSSSDSWMGGSSSDPTSEFVLKRKLDLEVFFKTLFGDFPALVRHPLVLDFFELGSLPPETMSVVATRVAARDLQQASSRPAGSSAYDKNGVDGATTGGQDLSWYTYDRSVMQGILSREVVYDERSAQVVKRSEGEGSGGGGGGRSNGAVRNATPSIAEIMNFTDDLGRMHKVK